MRRWFVGATVVAAITAAGMAESQTLPRDPTIEVQMGLSIDRPSSGRLIVVARSLDTLLQESPVLRDNPALFPNDWPVDLPVNISEPRRNWVGARDVSHIAPGELIKFDIDSRTFPGELSKLAPGIYGVQAALDVDKNRGYYRRHSAGDIVSKVIKITLPLQETVIISLDTVTEGQAILAPPQVPQPGAGQRVQGNYALRLAAQKQTQFVSLESRRLGAFWGVPTPLRAYVLLPPGYGSGVSRYPVAFVFQGFGLPMTSVEPEVTRIWTDMASGQRPPMIWVFLDQSGPAGTHEFADSINNGPWGEALVSEFIPFLDSHFRTISRSSGRFTIGRSSGGWAALWLQVHYPTVFGGTWSISPDPVDFRSFLGTNIYESGANVYYMPGGTAKAIIRGNARPSVTFEEFAKLERTVSDFGGQLASFEWVFSPRAYDGRPAPLFNRVTGDIDARVAAYWQDYDISFYLRHNWKAVGHLLDGKIHVIVGTKDDFYLNEPALMLHQELDKLGARTSFTFRENRGHIDVLDDGTGVYGMERALTMEMYRSACADSRNRLRQFCN